MKLEKGIAYHCATLVAAAECLEEAEKLGWKWWNDGAKPTSRMRYEKYLSDTCYMYDIDSNGLCYGESSDFINDNKIVVDYISKKDYIELAFELLSKTVFLTEGQFIPRECVIEVLNKYGAEIKEGE